jgi:hypothetical protein
LRTICRQLLERGQSHEVSTHHIRHFWIFLPGGKITLTHHFGVTGVPWAAIVTYALIIALPLRFYIPRALTRLQTGAPRVYAGSESAFP